MITDTKVLAALSAAAMIVLIGCGGPGLPPAGPGPNEVAGAYGTQDEEDVTGAVTSIADDDLGGFRPANVEELLRGRVPGLEIIQQQGGRTVYRIRGVATMEVQAPEPLFVVDGVQMSGDNVDDALAGLTRDDIRRVDVHKDIASTSVYGIRGAGGVIVISTNRR